MSKRIIAHQGYEIEAEYIAHRWRFEIWPTRSDCVPQDDRERSFVAAELAAGEREAKRRIDRARSAA